MRALTIGSMVCDISIKTDRLIFEKKTGTKIPLQDVSMQAGGGAVNSSIILSKLQLECSTVGILGKDAFATTVSATLAKYNIAQGFIKISDTAKTALSFLLPTKENETIILTYKGAGRLLAIKDLNPALKTLWDIVYIAPISGPLNKKLVTVLTKIKKQNPTCIIAHNPNPFQLEETAEEQNALLPLIDLYILNEEEARISWNQTNPEQTFNIKDYLARCANQAPKTLIVVTQGAKGIMWQRGSVQKKTTAKKIAQQHSVGAGDTCGATIAAALAHGYTDENAITLGMRTAETVLSSRNVEVAKITAPWQKSK